MECSVENRVEKSLLLHLPLVVSRCSRVSLLIVPPPKLHVDGVVGRTLLLLLLLL